MVVKKGTKTYTVNECKNHWNVKTDVGELSVNFEVDKELCKTEAELAEYIKNNDMF